MTATSEDVRRSLHRMVDQRIEMRVPDGIVSILRGVVASVDTSTQTAMVRLSPDSAPVPVRYPALAVELVTGDQVTVQRGAGGWLLVDHVLDRAGGSGTAHWENALDHGVAGDGETDDTASIEAFLNRGGDLYFPEGYYLIAGIGNDLGGVRTELTRSLTVWCHPNAVFLTDAAVGLDRNMIMIRPKLDGEDVPPEGITFAWHGGVFDQRNQHNGNSGSFMTGGYYPDPNPGSWSVAAALAIDCFTTANVLAIRMATVEGVTVYAGSHFEVAGGDSGITVDGPCRITDCRFVGHRDAGVYCNWNDTIELGGAQIVEHCRFENAIMGAAFKRGAQDVICAHNSFTNVWEAILTQRIANVPPTGDRMARVHIAHNTGRFVTRAIELGSADHAIVAWNTFIDCGAFEADGTTLIPGEARSNGAAFGIRASGCGNSDIIGNVLLRVHDDLQVAVPAGGGYGNTLGIWLDSDGVVDSEFVRVMLNRTSSDWEYEIQDDTAATSTVTFFGNRGSPQEPGWYDSAGGLNVFAATTPVLMRGYYHGANATAASLRLGKSRGATVDAFTAPTQNDYLGSMDFAGANGTSDFVLGARVRAQVTEATPSATAMASTLTLETSAPGTVSPSARLAIDSAGTVDIKDALVTSDVLSPASLGGAGSTDDYAPTGIGTATVLRLTCTGARDLTGITTGVSGRHLWLLNIGAQNIVLKHDVTSTAANRFYCPGSVDRTLTPNSGAHLIYDGTSSRWRVVDV